MKYWEHVIDKNLSFDNVKLQIEKYRPYYATRHRDGIHFYSKQGRYCILLTNGTILSNALDGIWATHKNDWMIVTITDEAVRILEENNLL